MEDPTKNRHIMMSPDPMLTITKLKEYIHELREGLARCRHQASFSIGCQESLSLQLEKVRNITNEYLNDENKARKTDA